MKLLYLAVEGCPSPGVRKTVHVNVVSSRRSVIFSWSYVADPEDYGFSLSLRGVFPAKIFNITLRQRIVYNLGIVFYNGQYCEIKLLMYDLAENV